jgi:hypothetical protein
MILAWRPGMAHLHEGEIWEIGSFENSVTLSGRLVFEPKISLKSL